MWEKFKAILAAMGINAGDKEAELKAELQKLFNESGGLPAPAGKVDDPETIRQLIEQNKILSQQVKDLHDAIGREQTARDAAIKAAEDKAKTDHANKIKDSVERAIKTDKKFPEAKRDFLTKMAEANYEVFEEFVKEAQPDKHLAGSKEKAGEQKAVQEPEKKASPRQALTDAIRASMDTGKTV